MVHLNSYTSRIAKTLVATALVAGITGGVLYGVINESAYRESATDLVARNAKIAAEKVRRTCGAAPLTKRANCVREAIPQYRLDQQQAKHDAADLLAQQTSALWTSIMGVAALIGMGLSAIGIALVWTTFREQRSATKLAHAEADRARGEAVQSAAVASAALQQAAAANEISKTQMALSFRPWLTVEAAGPYFDDRLDPRTHPTGELYARMVDTRLYLENIGSNVAIIVGWSVGLFKPDNARLDIVGPHSKDDYIILAEGGKISLNGGRIPLVIGAITIDGISFRDQWGRPPPIVGEIRYRDPTGQNRILGFGFQASTLHADTYQRWGSDEYNFDKPVAERRA